MVTPPDMATSAKSTLAVLIPRFRDLRGPHLAAILFALLMMLQTAGYLILGTGRAGMGLSEFVLVQHNLLALGCAWIAFRRAQGAAALFWFLFGVTLLVLLLPATILTFTTSFNRELVSSATWRVLYSLYGTPVLMMLFLPSSERQRLKAEIYLDLFQVTIVASLGFYTFFYLPLRHMLPSDALLRNLDLSNLESVFLLAAVGIRLRSVSSQARRLLLRLALFVLFCAIVTFIGNWIDERHLSTLSAWWDLGWALPYVAAGLVAITWTPKPESDTPVGPTNFRSFLGKNLALVGLLAGIHALTDLWQEANGVILTNVVVAGSLLAFTVRLALTQFHQHEEIAQRRCAQDELSAANETIASLLEETRMEASTIAQVGQVGTLLQSCSSRDEAFRLLPEWLARLFPGTSGSLSILDLSRTRAEPVVTWGTPFPLPQSMAATSSQPSGGTPQTPPGSPLTTAGAPITVPLIAHGEALGVLAIQDAGPVADISGPSSARSFDRQTQVAYSVAEHLALTIANLDLRETLRLEAIRDPLTGLYNRRHMQESLDREIHRALRRRRSLAVMLLDLDHFKHHNDTFGHAAGDEVLRIVAKTLLRGVRAEDLACRFGGEEFVVLLPECSAQQAAVRAEQVRRSIKSLHTAGKRELQAVVTVSIGVAAFPETTNQGELLLQCADEALYEAKRSGRNQVVVARPVRAQSTHA